MTTNNKITKAALEFTEKNTRTPDACYWSFRQGAKWGWNAALDQIKEDVEKTSLPVETKLIIQQLAEITKIL